MSDADSQRGPSAATLRAWRVHARLGDSLDSTLDWLVGGTLAEEFADTATRFPNRLAVVFPEEGIERTHEQLDDAAARLAGWLITRGIKPGDRAILCGYNTLAFVTAYLAILRVGGVVVLASPALAAPELARMVNDSGAVVAFCDEASGAMFDASINTVVRLDGPLPEGPLTGPVAVDGDAMAILAYTSGTTGAPKGVPLTHTNLLASIRAVTTSWQWTSHDVVFHALPLTHQHGLSAVHAALLSGSCVTILRSFDPETFVPLAREHRATILFAVPVMYERLLSAATGLDTLFVARGGTLRLAVSGSAPLSEDLFVRLAECFGEPVLERYGTTETGLDVSNPYEGPRLSGRIGLPLPGVNVRIVGADGISLGPGEDGELALRGPQVCREYWMNPEATKDAFDSDGWFRTGDIAQFELDTGYLRITGRKKELIISGGYNVYPREVELAIEAHPAVVEAAVAGVASTQWGEEVVAWVVTRKGSNLDESQLKAHTKARLASYKCPKRFAFVESLPHNNLGKLLRRELAFTLFVQSDQPTVVVHE